jgi:cephalosporin hydroxylase
MGEAMKKILCVLLLIWGSLQADPRIEGLKQRVLMALPFIEGWCSQEKAVEFIELVLEVKPDVYVEIGAFGGSSVFPVASALKFLGRGTLIAIDPWDKEICLKSFDPVEDGINYVWWSSINFNYIYSSYASMLKKYELEKYCTTLKMTSEMAAAKIDLPIDILYIDGSHSEEASTKDVELYLPKVRPGGYVWINDTLWAERQPALELLLEECDVVKLIDNGNCILFKKRAS